MSLKLATPPALLYRLGRQPDLLAWSPREYLGSGRFDDPRGEFRTLYAAEQRLACFAEILAKWRPSLETLAYSRSLKGDAAQLAEMSVIPADWHRKHLLVRLRLEPGQRWLDLRDLETLQTLRVELADLAVRLGLPDIDVSTVRGQSRQFTQAVARWAYERGYAGVAYRSRFDDSFDCWAIFEGAMFHPEGVPELIAPHDPSLRTIAELFGLSLKLSPS
ncbi:MAG: RES family NAD+ phosphorylase [Chloroflexota bacterium]